MNNWEDFFKDKLKYGEQELPDDDLSLFEKKLACSHLQQQSKAFPWLVSSFAAAVVLLLLFIVHPSSSIPENSCDKRYELLASKSKFDTIVPKAKTIPFNKWKMTTRLQKSQEGQMTSMLESDNKQQASLICEKNDSSVTCVTNTDSTVSKSIVNNLYSEKRAESQTGRTSFKMTKEEKNHDNLELKFESSRAKRNARVISISTAAFTSGIVASVLAGKAGTGSNITYAGTDNNSIVQENPCRITDVNRFPLIASLAVRYPLSDRFSLNSGAEYSFYSSTGHTDGNSWDQAAHYIGIPLRLDFSLYKSGPFDFYAGLGPMIDWCIKATVNGEDTQKDGYNISIMAAGGVEMKFSKHVGAFIEPRVSWLIPSNQQILSTYRTQHYPICFTTAFGLRFTIDN